MLSVQFLSDFFGRVRNRIFPVSFVDLERSPLRVLMTDEELRGTVARLKAHVAADWSPEVVAGLQHPNFAASRAFNWYQRISIPGTPAFTTSDPASQDLGDPGWLNRLAMPCLPRKAPS